MEAQKIRWIVPFGKCTMDCDKKWVEEYRRIVKKYDLKLGKYTIESHFIIYD